MKDAAQVLDIVLRTIGAIYPRPRMYGGNAGEVDAVLWAYRSRYLEILDRDPGDLPPLAMRRVHGRRHLGNTSIAIHYRRHTRSGATASEEEAIESVIRARKKIDAMLGIEPPGISTAGSTSVIAPRSG